MRRHLRDRFACRVANFALNRIATPWYRDMIGGSIRYGLAGAARDADEGRPPPTFPTDVTGVDERWLVQYPGDHRGRTTSP